jgi:hypothetical protein
MSTFPEILQNRLASLDQVGALKVQVKRIAAAIDRRVSQFVTDQHARRRRTFQSIYQRSTWGTDGGSPFFSGVGSNGSAAEFYVEQMAALLEQRCQKREQPLRLVDIGCGDFRIGKALVDRLPNTTYLGCDIVPELVAHNAATYGSERIRFRTLDAVCDSLPEGDVCLVRQVFQHLTNADILAVLQRLHYPVIYVSEGHPLRRMGPVNPDKIVGASVRFDWQTGQGRGVELSLAPFNLPSQEVFRFPAPPNEVIITERIDQPVPARKALSNSASAV